MTAHPSSWGPWIRHDGKCMPFSTGTIVEVFTDEDPETAIEGHILQTGVAGVEFGVSWLWTTETRTTQAALPIDYYRIKRPSGLDLLVSAMADAQIFEKADA